MRVMSPPLQPQTGQKVRNIQTRAAANTTLSHQQREWLAPLLIAKKI
jgi:hypothetical protein